MATSGESEIYIDEWSTRELLCLASAVVRYGAHNWVSVSCALLPFGEPDRPPDWFSASNCEIQYQSLRKRFSSKTSAAIIVQKLTEEHKMGLRKKMVEARHAYLKLQEDIDLVRLGKVDKAVINKWRAEVIEEEKKKGHEAIARAQWLKEREERKLREEKKEEDDITRVQCAKREKRKLKKEKKKQKQHEQRKLKAQRSFRPTSKVNTPVTGKKHKVSKVLNASTIESSDESKSGQEISKPELTVVSQLNTSTLQQPVTTSIMQKLKPVIAANMSSIASITKSDTSAQISTSCTTNVLHPTNSVEEEKQPIVKQITAEESLFSCTANVPNPTNSIEEEKESILKQITAEESMLPGTTDFPNPTNSVEEENELIVKQITAEESLLPCITDVPNLTNLVEKKKEPIVKQIIAEETLFTCTTDVPNLKNLVEEEKELIVKQITAEESLLLCTTDVPYLTNLVEEEKEPIIKQITAEESLLPCITDVPNLTNLVEEEKESIIKQITAEESLLPSNTDVPNPTNSVEEEKEPIVKQITAEESLLESSENTEKIMPVTEHEIIENIGEIKEEEILENEGEEGVIDANTTLNDGQLKRDNIKPENTETAKETLIHVEIPVKGVDIKPGSIEIIDITIEDEDSDGEMSMSLFEMKQDIIQHKEEEDAKFDTFHSQNTLEETTVYDEYNFQDNKIPENKSEDKPQSDLSIDVNPSEFSQDSTYTLEYFETFYEDMPLEIRKQSKSGKTKRDYSRIRKKQEKDNEMLLSVEKISTSLEENKALEEICSVKDSPGNDMKLDSSKHRLKDIEVTKQGKPRKAKRDYFLKKKKEEKESLLAVEKVLKETSSENDSPGRDKKSNSSKHKLKDNKGRSNCFQTKKEVLPKTQRRLLTTPATPSNSITNSPALEPAVYDDHDHKTWKKSIIMVYNRIAAHKYSSMFLKPITEEQAPGYHSTVYRPMDLQTIRRNINNGVIRTTEEFQRDVMLMFTNSLMYNRRHGSVYKMTLQMQADALLQIQIMQGSQAQLDAPARPETRESSSGSKRERQEN